MKYPKSIIKLFKSSEKTTLTLPTKHVTHQSSFNHLSHEQLGVCRLFLQTVQLASSVHSMQGHY